MTCEGDRMDCEVDDDDASSKEYTTTIGECPQDNSCEQEDRHLTGPIDASSASAPVPMRWIILGVVSHIIWGMYPVAARYLQVILGLPGLILLVGSNALALLVVQSCTCAGFGGKGGLRTGAAYSILVFARGSSNMLSARYATVIYIGIVNSFAPFIVAGLSWMTLREDTPKCLGPALVCSCVGTILAVVGQSEWGAVDASSSDNDFVGVMIAFVSIFASAGMRIFMKSSTSTLSGLMLVSWQYMSAIPLLAASLTTLNSPIVQRLQNISFADALAILIFVFVFTILTSLSQVTAVRHIGPTMDGSLQPLRLISTICAGRIVLGESVHSPIAWLGLSLILVTLTVYLHVQPRQSASLPVRDNGGDVTSYGRVSPEASNP